MGNRFWLDGVGLATGLYDSINSDGALVGTPGTAMVPVISPAGSDPEAMRGSGGFSKNVEGGISGKGRSCVCTAGVDPGSVGQAGIQ